MATGAAGLSEVTILISDMHVSGGGVFKFNCIPQRNLGPLVSKLRLPGLDTSGPTSTE